MNASKIGEAIAEKLYKHSIRLKSESDNIATGYVLQLPTVKRDACIIDVVNSYRSVMDNDVDIMINLKDLPEHSHNPWMLIYRAIFDDFDRYSSEIDEALWRMQCADKTDSWVDSAIDDMQMRRAS